MPAYEDPVHWLQKEAALPVNVDPSNSKLADPGRALAHGAGIR